MNKIRSGQLAYEAYCEYTGWKSLISGAPLPKWEDVKPEIKASWKASAEAILFHHMEQSIHQQMVEDFMRKAKQEVPSFPCIPSLEVRRLRAKLIIEEAFETVHALGFNICDLENDEIIDECMFGFPEHEEEVVLGDIIDGCIDSRVVNTGTLSACGIKDAHPQLMVDLNNLEKIEKGTLREDGKLIKPEGHKPPDWEAEIERQSKL